MVITFLVSVCTVIVFLIPNIVLGGAREVRLAKADKLTGQLTQAIGDNERIAMNSEITIVKVKYFENDTWAVVDLQTQKAGSAMAVLQKHDGIFVPVLGPGTSFDGSYVENTPLEVVNYLIESGAVSWY